MQNYYSIIGNIAKITPAQKGEKDFCYLTVAINNGKDKQGNPRPADFIDVDVWGNQAAFVEKYCQVGDLLNVSGVLKKSVYEKDGQKVSRQFCLATSVQKLASKGGGKNTDDGEQVEVENSADNIDISQDDLPF